MATEFRLLGPLEVIRDGAVVSIRGHKQRALLTILLLEANRTVLSSRLIELLWGEEAPETAAGVLQTYVSNLRKALEEDHQPGSPYRVLLSRARGYELRVPPNKLDLNKLEKRAAEGRAAMQAGEPALAVARFTDALEMWRGQALGDLASEPAGASHVLRLEETRLGLIEDRFAARMALGERRPLVAELEQLVSQHPLRERLAAQLMVALYQSGRQADASAVYQEARERLVNQLGMEPGPEMQEALRRVLQHDAGIGPVARRSQALHPNNLPAEQTSFIGRGADLSHVTELLSKARMVTLTGFGGTGKTRLALHAAADLIDEFDDGVWFVDLGSIVDPQLVLQTLARTLGLRERRDRRLIETVLGFLEPKRTLVVLDNCEHLVGEAAALAQRLIASCPDVRVMATSRQRLRIDGEHVYPVPALPLPSTTTATGLADITASDAVRLFVERASMVLPSFSINEKNAATIAKLCRQLDGIPLALELAAAQVASMTPKDILERMDDRFRILSSGRRTGLPRQQTLLATVEWSHQLLTDQEKALFRRLAIFAGGFELGAAESVCIDPSAVHVPVVELLTGLVDKSLVICEEGILGLARYRLLETLREFGRERLGQSDEDESVRKRHADYFLSFADDAERKLRGPEAESQLALMELEHDNLRTALSWSIKHDRDVALRLASAWSPFWFAGGHLTEGREWLSLAIRKSQPEEPSKVKSSNGAAHVEVLATRNQLTSSMARLSTVAALAPEDRSRLRAQALWRSGILAFHQGDLTEARRVYEEALSIESVIDSPLRAALLNGLGMVSSDEGDLGAGRNYYERSLEVAERCRDIRAQAVALSNLGACAWGSNELETARRLKVRAGELMRHEGDRVFLAVNLLWLGRLEAAEGRLDEAGSLMREGLVQLRDLKEQMWTGMAVEFMSHLASLRSQPERALRLGAAYEAHLEKIGSTALWFSTRPQQEASWQQMRDLLGPETARVAWETGRLMSLEEAVTYALTESDEGHAQSTSPD